MVKKKIKPVQKHHAFMDGSGDGSKKGNCWVSVLTIVENPADLHKIDTKILSIPKKIKTPLKAVLSCGEYKFHNYIKAIDSYKCVKKHLVDKLSQIRELESLKIYVIIIEVSKVKKNPDQIHRERFSLLIDYARENFKKIIDGKINLRVYSDRNFFPKRYMYLGLDNIEGVPQLYLHEGDYNKDSSTKREFIINHYDSKKSKGIQLTDLISGAIFHKEERNNSEFFDIIKSKIKVIQRI